jgi:hypothetical protein
MQRLNEKTCTACQADAIEAKMEKLLAQYQECATLFKNNIETGINS